MSIDGHEEGRTHPRGSDSKPVVKTLVLNSDNVAGLPRKIEGVAVISPTEMIVFNDSDFGIEGDGNKMLRVPFEEPVLR